MFGRTDILGSAILTQGRKGRRPRRLFRLTLPLAIATTIAIAWVISIFAPLTYAELPDLRAGEGSRHRVEGFGASAVITISVLGRSNDGVFKQSLVRSLNPAWPTPRSVTRVTESRGWPIPALKCAANYCWSSGWSFDPPNYYIALENGIPIDQLLLPATCYTDIPRMLPYEIRPVGFVVDVLFYWCLWIGLVAGRPVIRRMRWRQRGCCVACGHDLHSASICPECGVSTSGTKGQIRNDADEQAQAGSSSIRARCVEMGAVVLFGGVLATITTTIVLIARASDVFMFLPFCSNGDQPTGVQFPGASREVHPYPEASSAALDSHVPSWPRPEDVLSDNHRLVDRIGWPFTVVTGTVEYCRVHTDKYEYWPQIIYTDHWALGDAIDIDNVWEGWAPRGVPNDVQWMGVVGDTLVYAVVLLVVGLALDGGRRFFALRLGVECKRGPPASPRRAG